VSPLEPDQVGNRDLGIVVAAHHVADVDDNSKNEQLVQRDLR
jgi:hypothetical protein